MIGPDRIDHALVFNGVKKNTGIIVACLSLFYGAFVRDFPGAVVHKFRGLHLQKPGYGLYLIFVDKDVATFSVTAFSRTMPACFWVELDLKPLLLDQACFWVFCVFHPFPDAADMLSLAAEDKRLR